MLRNQVQLITYPGSLGGTLADVTRFIDTYLKEVIGGVHILPFYPSSADRGFAPLSHMLVDPQFGTWEDIKTISGDYDLVVDLVVNHVSSESEYFQSYVQDGPDSAYAACFLDVDLFLKRYNATAEDLSDVYRPRQTLPFSAFTLADGSIRKIWTTFSKYQIDLDVEAEETKVLLQQFINQLVDHGANMIRLDAVGYAVKRPGTSCFLIPETYDFLQWVRGAVPPAVEILAEVHREPSLQQDLLESESVEWVYDFSLPFLMLHALYAQDVGNLRNWIAKRPSKMITTLDTHDGIGVVDVEDLMTEEEIKDTAEWVKHNGAVIALRALKTEDSISSVGVYQLDSAYYSALGEDDDAYITARAVQFFIPGIPQVYYVGLLAGTNDRKQFTRTQHGRDLNRHNYTWAEIETAMEQDVVQRLLRLMRLRSTHPAFNGTFSLLPSDSGVLILRWELGNQFCEATIDVQSKTVAVTRIEPETEEEVRETY